MLNFFKKITQKILRITKETHFFSAGVLFFVLHTRNTGCPRRSHFPNSRENVLKKFFTEALPKS